MIFLLGTAWAGEDPFAVDATVHTLDNGLTVVLAESHRTDTVALHIRFGVGAGDERPGEYGCAHLFEHLMFEGSAHVPGNGFDTWLTGAGGDNNAFTSEDQTAYYMRFPSGALDLALFLESDRLGFLEAGLTAENLANQQSVVLQERQRHYDAPHGRDFDALTVLLYPPEHPYGHTVIGTWADVEGFTLDGVRGFWGRHYRPRNAVLGLVGNFDTDEALERVEYWFGDVPDRGSAPERPAVPEVGARAVDGVLFDKVDQRTLYLAWPTVPHGHPDEPALELLAYVLSDGRGTRLDDAVYYDRGLATESNAYASSGNHSGQLLLWATSEKKPLAKLDKAMGDVVGSLIEEPPTAAELERARSSMRSRLLDATEDPLDLAELLVDCQFLEGDAGCTSARWEAIAAVTPADLERAARTWLTDDTRVTLSVVPVGDDGALPGAIAVELP